MVDGALKGVRRRRAVSTEARPAQDLASPYRRSLRHPGGEGVPVVQPHHFRSMSRSLIPRLDILGSQCSKSCLTAS